MNIDVIPVIIETSGDSIGMDASSAIMKITMSWNGDIFDSSDFPMTRSTKRTIKYRSMVRMRTLANLYTSLY